MIMAQEMKKQLDKIHETLTDIRVSQARTETTLESVVSIQDRHEEEIKGIKGKIDKIWMYALGISATVGGMVAYLEKFIPR